MEIVIVVLLVTASALMALLYVTLQRFRRELVEVRNVQNAEAHAVVKIVSLLTTMHGRGLAVGMPVVEVSDGWRAH